MYFNKRNEISCEEKINNGNYSTEEKIKKKCFGLLHEGHLGIAAMRLFGRLNKCHHLDEDIEYFVKKKCRTSQDNIARDSAIPLFSWAVPWIRRHTDYAGPFVGPYWLVLADSPTKFLEMYPAQNITGTKTVSILEYSFA